MDKEEAKHLSDVLKAYSENKIIQIRTCKGWEDVLDDKIKFCGSPEDYRIKPEPKIRPYATAEEFLKGQKEHGPYFKYKECNKNWFLPDVIDDEGCHIGVNKWDSSSRSSVSYSWICDKFKWLDGTPCGILENT